MSINKDNTSYYIKHRQKRPVLGFERIISSFSRNNVTYCASSETTGPDLGSENVVQVIKSTKVAYKSKTVSTGYRPQLKQPEYIIPKLNYIHERRSLNPPVVYGDSAAKLVRQQAEILASKPVKAPIALTWEEIFDRKVRTEMKYDLLGTLKKVNEEIRKSPHNPPELAVIKVLGPKSSVDDFSSH